MALISRYCTRTIPLEVQVMPGSIPVGRLWRPKWHSASLMLGAFMLFFSRLAPRVGLLVFLLVSAAIDG